MVTDHTETSNDLEGLVTGGKVKAELPTAVDSSHQSKLDKLKDASGKDFSSDFDSYQVSAHKDAVSLFERYAKGGDSADLKDWAGKTLPTLRHHLEMAQELGKTPSVGQSSKSYAYRDGHVVSAICQHLFARSNDASPPALTARRA